MIDALRLMSRRPGGYVLAATTLTVGIAVTLTMFAVADSILLRPFSFQDQDRLVTVWASDPQRGVPRLEVMWYELERYRAESKAFSDFAAFSSANNAIVLKRGDESVQMRANIVSRSFLPMLGVQARPGRIFTEEEHRPGGPPAAVLSHAAWTNLFGADPAIVGETLHVGAQPVVIVGVLPQHLDLPSGADIIFPLESALPDEDSRNSRVLTGLAKLREGATLEQGRTELATIASRIEQDRPETHQGITVAVFPLVGEMLGATGPAVLVLLAMGIALLLIALFNVANLFLTRAVARDRETSVRIALGATRGHLLGRLVTEAGIVTAGAGAAGLLLARLGLSMLRRWAPQDLPRVDEIAMRGRTGLVLLAISVASCIALAWLSTLRPGASGLTGLLGGSRRISLGRATRRLLHGAVVAQVALTLLLLAAAGSLARTFVSLSRIDVGFRKEGVITAHVPRGYTFGPQTQQAERRLYFDRLFERVRALPGVQAAGSVLMRPLEMEQGWDFAYTVQGQGPAEQKDNPMANLLSTTPGYFEAMGIALRAGRAFDGTDRKDSKPVVVVGESFARRLGGIDHAVGRLLKSGPPDSQKPWIEVVGVVADVRYRALTTEKLDIYVPYTQTNWSPNYLAVRVDGDPENLVAPLRAITRELDPDAPLSSVRTTAQLVGSKLAQPRLNSAILALFAATAVFLAFVGLYGLLSYVTRLRAQELGVRVCLGATAARLRRMVVGEALGVGLSGVLLGAALTLGLARLASSALAGIGAIEPWLLAATGGALTAVCVVAALGPAVRATRVHPAVVLRGD